MCIMNDALLHFINLWILTPISLFFRCVFIAIVCMVLRRLWTNRSKKKRVAVVVVGDVGRSPRMCYHSLSLAQHGFEVDLIGYLDSRPHASVLESKHIQLKNLRKPPAIKGIPRMLIFVFKVIFQSLNMLWVLGWKVNATEYVLVQNPPCIPSLAICWCICLLNGSKLIIDWHNYGYSILALSLNKAHPLVKIAKWYEEIFGQLSCGNLCVTRAMEKDLQLKWHICAEIMHDRPSKNFQKLTNEMKHQLFLKLSQQYPEFESRDSDSSDSTRFTSRDSDCDIVMKSNRPALLISSTSWTDDEDFSVLLEALQLYENEINEENVELPSLLCAITGKGPNKSHYQEMISKKEWKHVEVITPWLEAEDYPKLLACSDLGVSLHTSSSGLDLPMKVVDMFGCGLPVAAINFSCLDELVQHDVNGFVFEDAAQLSKQLLQAFADFPQRLKILDGFRENVEKFRERTWDDAWNEIVLPLFRL